MVFRNGGHAARDGIRTRVVRKVADVVHDRLRLGGQRRFFMRRAPVHEVAPVGVIRLDRVLRLRPVQPPLALLRKRLVLFDCLIVPQEKIFALFHLFLRAYVLYTYII